MPPKKTSNKSVNLFVYDTAEKSWTALTLGGFSGAGLLTESTFTDVFGSASLVVDTQADDIENTTDALATSAFLYAFDGTKWDRVRMGAFNNALLVTVDGTITVTTGADNISTQFDSAPNTIDTNAVSSFLYGFNGTTWDRLRADATNGLLVNLGTNNDVNIIAGQDGIAAGSAVIGFNTPSVTLATDDPAVVSLAAMNAKMVSGTDIGDVTINNASGAAAVNIQDGGNSITVDGTITANLSAVDNAVLDDIASNTSGALTALQIIDDWDEANRAKVNLIVGSAGITGGAGAVAASTPRVTLASNDPAVALLGTIDAVLDSIKDTAGIKKITDALPAGTNAIGKLAANSGVDIGDVDVTSQPARDRATDNIGVAHQTDAIMADTTALTPKFAAISATTDNGNNTLVAAGTGTKIRVLSLYLVSDADDTDVRFESGAGGTALSGRIPLKESTGFVLPFNPVGWLETDDGDDELLNLEITGTGNIYGGLTYVEVPD